MKQNDRGFTLMELLIVIAIISVLVAIAIPMFSSQLEKSREVTDLANVRAAYAQVSTEAMLGDTDAAVTVKLRQKKADWQSVDPVNIGGIVHSRGQGDTDNWIGVAAPGGSCVVSYDESCGVVLTWSGTAAPSKPDYPFDTSIRDYFSPLLYATDFWKTGMLAENKNFELDSRCPNSAYIPGSEAELAKLNKLGSNLNQIARYFNEGGLITNPLAKELHHALQEVEKIVIRCNEAELAKMNNSLLQQGDCTWAFLGDGREGQNAKRYLFWTSFNTNKVGAGKQIPVLIQTGDGKYYVSETTTGQRTDKKGAGYVAISKSLFVNQYTDQYKKVLDAGTEYLTLEDAYDAYITALNNAKYDEVRESSRG